MTPSAAQLVASLEIALAIAGVVLSWRLFLRPAARATRAPARLSRWEITLPDFALFLVFVLCGSFACALMAGLLSKELGLRGDAATVVTGAGAQLGMLGGACVYWVRPGRGRPETSAFSNVLQSGAVTFLISLPFLLLSANIWELVLKQFNLPTERQSLIAMFANAESPLLLVIMILLAIIIAPLTEELVFRAGLFRFLRGRVPRWVALAAPGLIFASLHVNWSTLEGLTSLAPLVVLAVMFSLAYERTGNIGTPIVAHALFNLNTVILIFSGVGL
jgi:membrane protease YdiL (CAAX protease family)